MGMFRSLFLKTAMAFLSISTSVESKERIVFFYTGSELLEQCSSQSQIKKGHCEGFIIGVFDSITVCGALNIKMSQVSEVAISFLREIPKIQHYEASILVKAALEEAFPCQ
jgi:hypothetical protein